MEPTTIKFVNYKLLKEETFHFPEGNVYLIMGSNNKGKTSFINGFLDVLQAKNTTPNPVTHGEKEGSITLEIEDAGGNPFMAQFEFTDSTAKFTLITPEGISTKKVTDIRNFFNYQAITGEEFIKLGDNEKDRKRQRDIFLSMMEPEYVETFNTTEEALNKIFKERTELGRELKVLEGTLSAAVTKEDLELIEKKDSLLQEKKNLEIKKDKATEMKSKVAELQISRSFATNSIRLLEEKIQALKDELIQHQAKLEEANQTIENIDRQINNIPIIEYNQTRYDEINQLIDQINQVAGKALVQKASQESYDKKKETHDEQTTKVEELREKLRKILEEHSPQIPNIRVASDGLHYVDGDLDVPFHENQVGTAQLYKITAKILMALNKKFPIILMGRAESLDMDAIHSIAQMAHEMGAKVIFDRVLPNESNIALVGIEDLEDSLIENIQKK